jgi:hypothetical protein
MDNTKDNKSQNNAITKTVRFKINRPSPSIDKKSLDTEVKRKSSSPVSVPASQKMPQKTVVLNRGKSSLRAKPSTSAELSSRNNTSLEAMKSDVGSRQIEKTIKLKRRNISSAVPVADSEITKTQSLKLRSQQKQSSSVKDISKTQIIKLRVPRQQSSSEATALANKKADELKSIDSAISKKDIASYSSPLPEQNLASVDLDKNIKPPPQQAKEPSVNMGKKEISSLKKEANVSNELSLDLEAALDALSTNAVEREEEVFKNEESTFVKPEKNPLTEKEEKTENVIEESTEDNQNKYGFIFALVALLTLVGLVGLVYMLFASLSLLG